MGRAQTERECTHHKAVTYNKVTEFKARTSPLVSSLLAHTHTQWLTEERVIPFLWADIKISVLQFRGPYWARSLSAPTLPSISASGTRRPWKWHRPKKWYGCVLQLHLVWVPVCMGVHTFKLKPLHGVRGCMCVYDTARVPRWQMPARTDVSV